MTSNSVSTQHGIKNPTSFKGKSECYLKAIDCLLHILNILERFNVYVYIENPKVLLLRSVL